MSFEAISSVDPVEPVVAGGDIPVAVETFQSVAALQLRVALIQDQLIAAAKKVNLLHGMGLERTSGYAEAMALYESKQADLDALKARYVL